MTIKIDIIIFWRVCVWSRAAKRSSHLFQFPLFRNTGIIDFPGDFTQCLLKDSFSGKSPVFNPYSYVPHSNISLSSIFRFFAGSIILQCLFRWNRLSQKFAINDPYLSIIPFRYLLPVRLCSSTPYHIVKW